MSETKDWQPIETAPKDGTPFLGYWPGGGAWNIPSQGVRWTWFWSVGDQGRFAGHFPQLASAGDTQPTHWMPLPLPPESSGRILADANSKEPQP